MYVPDYAPENGMSAVWHNSTCEAVVLCVWSCLYVEKESAVNCR